MPAQHAAGANIAMVHDFAATERHLVFLPPLPKDGLDPPRWVDLPAGFVVHLGGGGTDSCRDGAGTGTFVPT